MRNMVQSILVLLLLTVAPILTHAESITEGWQFKLGTFFWAADMKTTLETPTTTVSGTAKFQDIVEYATPSINLTFAAQKGKLSVHTNFFNVHLKNDFEDSSGAKRGVRQDIYIPEAFVAYDVVDTAMGENVTLKLAPYAGIRYFSSRMLIDNVGGGEWRDTQRDASDAIGGLYAEVGFGEKLSLTLRGDAGGFGWGGDSNDKDYFGLAGLNWHYANNKTLSIGYAYLKFSRDNIGKAGNINAEVEFSGPILSHAFNF